MVEAVLFAWGHTLAIWAPDDEPHEDYQAFTQMDVLNVVRRLNGE